MASVRKRKWTHKGVEREAWIVNYTDLTGKRRLKTFDKKRDAETFRIGTEGEISTGLHVSENDSVTVAEAVADFIRDSEKQWRRGDITGVTFTGRKGRLIHPAATMGHKIVCKLTTADFQELVDDLQDVRGFKANTVNGIYQECYRLMQHCVRRRWTRRNVLKDDKCRTPKRQRRTQIPTRTEISQLYHASREWRPKEPLHAFVLNQTLVALGVFGGLRPGEIFGLQWENIDEPAGLIRIRHSQSVMDGLKGPKSEAGNRDVPITTPISEALAVVARYRAYQRMARAPSYRDVSESGFNWRMRSHWRRGVAVEPTLLSSVKTGYVLTTRQGKPLTPASAWCGWHTLMAGAGLVDPVTERGKFTPHALRHAAASLLIANGLPAMNLKDVMGHSSVATTYDVYGHLFPEDDRTRQAMNVIAAGVTATTERHIRLIA